MNDKRNFLLTLGVLGFILWTLVAWLMLGSASGSDAVMIWMQRIFSTSVLIICSGWLFYGLKIEDKLPDKLRQAVGDMYYEAEGVSFMPTIRKRKQRAELRLYFQNRYENPANVIIHLRPPKNSIVIRPGVRDVHLAFTAGGGAFGYIVQPIAVPDHLQGEVIEVKMVATSHYPRGHGDKMRKHEGIPAGDMLVDWTGAAFRTGVHEVSGEIELSNSVTVHLPMPRQVSSRPLRNNMWRQRQDLVKPV